MCDTQHGSFQRKRYEHMDKSVSVEGKNVVGFSVLFFAAFFKQLTVVCDASMASEQRAQCSVVKYSAFIIYSFTFFECSLFVVVAALKCHETDICNHI